MNWNISDEAIFIGMVFIAAFLLVQSFVVPAFGENRQARKRLKQRLQSAADKARSQDPVSVWRRRQLSQLSSLSRFLEGLPGMGGLERTIEQAGRTDLAHRVVLRCLVFGVLGVMVLNLLLGQLLIALLGGFFCASLPYLGLLRARSKRLALFEEQLPEALVIMSRALRAGHPFADALHLVGAEMPEPIGPEFRRTFMEVNYGGELRQALNGLLSRVGSVTVMVFVTSVQIQKETGGNLAELLENLAAVVRDRFRFHRKLRTLSAEGRLAAWILSLLPFALAAVLTVVNPGFIPMLTENETGRKLVLVAFGLIIAGILWMRRIVRIDV